MAAKKILTETKHCIKIFIINMNNSFVAGRKIGYNGNWYKAMQRSVSEYNMIAIELIIAELNRKERGFQ